MATDGRVEMERKICERLSERLLKKYLCEESIHPLSYT